MGKRKLRPSLAEGQAHNDGNDRYDRLLPQVRVYHMFDLESSLTLDSS